MIKNKTMSVFKKILLFIIIFISVLSLFPFENALNNEIVKAETEEVKNQDTFNEFKKISDIGKVNYGNNQNDIFTINENYEIEENLRSDRLFSGVKFTLNGMYKKDDNWLSFDPYNDEREYKFSLYRTDSSEQFCYLVEEFVIYFSSNYLDCSASIYESHTSKIKNGLDNTVVIYPEKLKGLNGRCWLVPFVYVGYKNYDNNTQHFNFYPDVLSLNFKDKVDIRDKTEILYTYDTLGYDTVIKKINKIGHSRVEKMNDYDSQGYKCLDFRILNDYASVYDLGFNEIVDSFLRCLNFTIDLNEDYCSYFVRFDYDLHKPDKITTKEVRDLLHFWETNTVKTAEKVEKVGYLQTKPFSIYSYCKKVKDNNFEDYAYNEIEKSYINTIVHNLNNKKVNVSYLVPIDGTPFAIKTTKKVEVPLIMSKLPYSYFTAELGVTSFNIFNSTVKDFTYDTSTDTYNAEYRYSLWLKSKTIDGFSVNCFLNVQNSYEDYFGNLVKKGMCPSGLYDYMFNGLINTYVEKNKDNKKVCDILNSVKEDEIYGFFGYVAVPESYNVFNKLFSELFNYDTGYKGIAKSYKYTAKISYSEYDAMQKDYNYNFIKRFFNHLGSWLDKDAPTANYYFFWADGTEDRVMIAENGSKSFDNDNGLAFNVTKKGVTKGAKAIENTFKKLGNKISNFFKKFNFKKGLIIIACILVGLFIFWLTIKIIKSIKD